MQFVGKVNDHERMVVVVVVVVMATVHNDCVQMEGPRVMRGGVGR